MKSDIPKETKVTIIQRQLQLVNNSLYSSSIDVRVAETVGDEQMKKVSVEQMKKFEKMKDEYEKILQELDNEKQ